MSVRVVVLASLAAAASFALLRGRQIVVLIAMHVDEPTCTIRRRLPKVEQLIFTFTKFAARIRDVLLLVLRTGQGRTNGRRVHVAVIALPLETAQVARLPVLVVPLAK